LLLTSIPVDAQDPTKQTGATAPESKAESWKNFSSAEGRFSADFPGTPAFTTRLAGGERQTTLYMYSLGTSAAYGVSYFELGSTDGGVEAAKKALDAGVDGMINDYGSDQLTVSEIVVAGYPARLLTKRLKNGYTLRVKMLVVGTRQFQITSVVPSPESVGTENVALYEAASNRFIDSFQLLTNNNHEGSGEVDLWLQQHKEVRVYGVCAAESPDCKAQQARNKDSVLNGKAMILAKPAYPPLARAAKASGTVTVQVVIDEAGVVVAAQAISGPPLLYGASVQAARDSKFLPAIIDGKPVTISGVIQYNFVAQ
jgi:TonB family protein